MTDEIEVIKSDEDTDSEEILADSNEVMNDGGRDEWEDKYVLSNIEDLLSIPDHIFYGDTD